MVHFVCLFIYFPCVLYIYILLRDLIFDSKRLKHIPPHVGPEYLEQDQIRDRLTKMNWDLPTLFKCRNMDTRMKVSRPSRRIPPLVDL